MDIKLEKKTLTFFAGIIIATFGVTNTLKNEFLSILVLFLGVYLIIKGLE